MRDKLTDFFRVGKVSSINPAKCKAKVTFEDRSDIVSRELFITVPFTLKDRAYYMPVIGERVLCVFDPGAPSVGYILGSYYADTRLPPYKDENKTYANFEDETLVEYDKKLHKLTVHIPEVGETSIDIVTASVIDVNADDNINVHTVKVKNLWAEDDINVQTDTQLKVLVKAADKDVEAYLLVVNGREDTLDFTVKNKDKDKETIKLHIDGNEGDLRLSTKNYDTDNETTAIEIFGQDGLMNLITKNKDTGNETAYVKMDGAAKTIEIQGYVTVKGSHTVSPTVIPD